MARALCVVECTKHWHTLEMRFDKTAYGVNFKWFIFTFETILVTVWSPGHDSFVWQKMKMFKPKFKMFLNFYFLSSTVEWKSHGNFKLETTKSYAWRLKVSLPWIILVWHYAQWCVCYRLPRCGTEMSQFYLPICPSSSSCLSVSINYTSPCIMSHLYTDFRVCPSITTHTHMVSLPSKPSHTH